jgi:hypothetical protein
MCKSLVVCTPLIEFEVIKTFVTIPEPRHPALRRSASAPATARFCQATRVVQPRARTPKGKAVCTTVMVRNLPNRTKLDRMENFLASLGFEKYESVYMPMDSRTGMNKGYAFVHFKDGKTAEAFCIAVEGMQFPNSRSSKRLSASAASYQGAAVKPKQAHQDQVTGSFAARAWAR